MNYFICVGHADYGNGVISSADGTKSGGVNEYKYNVQLARYVAKWLKKAGHKVTVCIAPAGKMKSLNDEIAYFIGEEHKQDYDLSVQLHLNAFNTKAYGCEVYAYNEEGKKVAERICKKLGTVWKNRGAEIKTGDSESEGKATHNYPVTDVGYGEFINFESFKIFDCII